MRGNRAQILLFLLTAVVLAACLSVLVWLRVSIEGFRDESLSYTTSLFTRDEVIGPPHDINFRFGQIEGLAGKSRASIFVNRIYVTKILDERGEWPIHPFWLAAPGRSDWRKIVDGCTALPLETNGQRYGVLYVDEDRAALRSLQYSIVGLAAMLVLNLGLLTARLVTQQSALTGVREALAEKERQMIHLERLSLVGQLSANILHDIKKPVINIQNSADDLETALRDMAGGSVALRNIRTQTELFLSILRDLGLERFVRSDDSDAEYCDIHDVLRQSCDLVRYEKKGTTEIVWELRESAPLVLAPHYRLIQVFSNLVLNAYQAMGDEGRLTLRTRLADGVAIAEIRDNGPGVTEAMRDRLFEPFETSKPEGQGTGLGLYISRSIVEDLGGSLRLDNTEEGACFIVELPRAG